MSDEDNNIIKVDFDNRETESKYYNISTDEPGFDPVVVSILSNGVEILQQDPGSLEIQEVFLSDEQLSSILLILAIEEGNNDGKQEPTIYDA